MNHKLRAVIYIRVSDEEQIKNNSLETQLKACKDFASRNNLEVIKVFREEGFSAKFVSTRPEMLNLLNFCVSKKNNIQRVLVYKMDRFARNVEDGLTAISLLSKNGTIIYSVTEATESTPIGRAIRTILLTIGQLDNELKGERVKDNMQTMFNKGLWCWKSPLGYAREGESKDDRRGKPLIEDPRLSLFVKSLFEKANSGYFTKTQLANFLNSIGFEKKHGKPATGKLVAEILNKTFYYGYMYAPKWNAYQWGTHPQLVTKEVWERANSNTFRRKNRKQHLDSDLFPIKGTLMCSECGKSMTSSNPRGYRVYLMYECHNKQCAKNQRITTELATEQFIKILESVRPTNRVLKLFTEMVFSEWDKQIQANKKEVQLKEAQIKILEDKLTSIAESNNKGILTDEEALERSQATRNEILVLRVERSDSAIDQLDMESVRNFTELFLTNINKLWIELSLPEKQMLQSEIFPEGVICKNKTIRTTTLSHSFQLIEQLKDENYTLVTPQGVEPCFVG